MRSTSSILVTFLFLSVSAQESSEGLWPLVTPLLGVSEPCLQASREYMENLSGAFNTTATEPLSEQQRNAAQMFDSNGMFPFLQEGKLQDVTYVDLCDSILVEIPDCQQTIPPELRWLRMPNGNANGPGSESGCKAAGGSKYCHNYYQFYIPTEQGPFAFNLENIPSVNSKQKLDRFNMDTQRLLFDPSLLSRDLPVKSINQSSKSDLQLDHSKLFNLQDLLVERSSYFREVQTQLTTLYEDGRLFPQQDSQLTVDQVVGVWLSLWLQVNFLNGVGEFGLPGLAYQGMCFPSACSVEDIEINSRIFSQRFQTALGLVISSPIINEGLGSIFQLSPEEALQTSVGCSDRDIFSGVWKLENYVVVTVLAVIGVFTLLGTALDYKEININAQNTGYHIIKAFSLKENIKFVFEAPAKGGTGRFECLEGMRSLSMTWVILGHHFYFADSALHVRNVEYVSQVRSKHAGGVLFEAVAQGEYSVDTFLFIGATLLSYLLLKDLDKSNGWFSSGAGVVRMVLFYINRYLRITIPYALAMAVFIGVIPLVLRDNMAAGHLAYAEAEGCKRVMGYHMAYLNIFPDYGYYDNCMGQTWYLSCDMILFIISPLLIYPLWLGKYGRVLKIVGILWWAIVLSASCVMAYWYVTNYETYKGWETEYRLPDYNFSPWGWRSQCYIIGIITGYILYLTKDNKVVIDRKLNLVIWFNALVLGLVLVYRPYRDFDWESQLTLDKIEAGWGLCLAWVTFSCCRGYGGVVNDFLSWNFWLPISKISFMTYLFHMSLNWYFFLLQPFPLDFSMWQLTVWFTAQVWFCLLAGLLGCLTLELPFGKIQKILIQKLMKL